MENIPYVLNRRDLDRHDKDDAAWLARHPKAVAFGVDDGAIRAAFATPDKAAVWLALMVCDSVLSRKDGIAYAETFARENR